MGAFYRETLANFFGDDPARILGRLSSAVQHRELQRRQITAWKRELAVLLASGKDLVTMFPQARNWSVLLEYPIPRRHRRLDAVLLAADVIFCLEFKTQDKVYTLSAQRQVEDYALDLRDFHKESAGKRIVPIVVVPNAPTVASRSEITTDPVSGVRLANATNLVEVIAETFSNELRATGYPIDAAEWDNSEYRPVPTIIEAAEALYAGHNVRELVHSHAGVINLTLTSDKLVEIIREAQLKAEKVICFVTGVPGAGKTLAGLNVVHNPALRREGRPAGVFLSGNGPLVKIVSAAISRDQKRRNNRGDEERIVSTFIQNVHTFVREGLEKPSKPPVERIVVFDEAQRAWNAGQNLKKTGLDISEPDVMLSILDRHIGWAVLIALIGGGQEIHSGEAGLMEWGKTLREKYAHWNVTVSPKALDIDVSLSGHRLFPDDDYGLLEIRKEPALHLEVNVRSFRARKLAEWVDAVLALTPDRAAALMSDLGEFPVALTRSRAVAREWLRNFTRGRHRCGLVASSGALRFRADGLELSTGFRQGNRDMYVHWFLAEPPDVRSSNQLEVAASEFECQGLELDWVGVCWGGDFAFDSAASQWSYRHFSGSRWGILKGDIDRRYLLNTYRVLLTRARRGFIIWIPIGDSADETRPPALFDSTADYLQKCGLKLI